MTFKTFETKRLILKPTEELDAEFILELFETPKWIQYIGDRKLGTIEKTKEYIRIKMISQYQRLGYSNYTVICKEDNIKIGVCGIYDRDGLDNPDIGFGFLPEYEGRGFAYEASSKIRDEGFKSFGLDVISAITQKDNVGSQKLLKKLHFENIGTTILPDEIHELYLFELTRNSWNEKCVL